MTYPIFNSFVNQIKSQLNNKEFTIKTFKTWHEDRINATGLEILIDVSKHHNFIKEVSINFDWDRFREIGLAHQLQGLQEHPMLQKNSLKSVTVSPKIDVELSWNFDEQNTQIAHANTSKAGTVENAGRWMENISKNVNKLLAGEDVITRWHIEVEGSRGKKSLSAARLITYFQYSLEGLHHLNEVHSFVKTHIQAIIVKSQKVQNIADDTFENVA